MDLVFDKQWAAVAEMMGERISEENPPVDIKSPMRLKKDVEAEEKVFAGKVASAESNDTSNGAEGESGASEGEEELPSEESAEEAPENETPTFGLG